MRNLGTRFNMSNVISLVSGDVDELAKAVFILCKALEVDPKYVTPSEQRILSAFEEWYLSYNDATDVSFRRSPAYAYVNLNTGINLLFLMNNAYDAIQGLEIGLYSYEDVSLALSQLSTDHYD